MAACKARVRIAGHAPQVIGIRRRPNVIAVGRLGGARFAERSSKQIDADGESDPRSSRGLAVTE
jgi:hypothetical protein